MELEFRGGNPVGTSIMVSTEFIHAVIKQRILTEHTSHMPGTALLAGDT